MRDLILCYQSIRFSKQGVMLPNVGTEGEHFQVLDDSPYLLCRLLHINSLSTKLFKFHQHALLGWIFYILPNQATRALKDNIANVCGLGFFVCFILSGKHLIYCLSSLWLMRFTLSVN